MAHYKDRVVSLYRLCHSNHDFPSLFPDLQLVLKLELTLQFHLLQVNQTTNAVATAIPEQAVLKS